MNIPYQNTLMGKLSNIFLVYNPLFDKVRNFKDQLFKPLSYLLDRYHVTPWLVSVIGLLLGLFSLLALLVSYWFFVILMSISLLFDCVDGSLARYSQQVSSFGKYLDFIIDHVLMILMVISLCYYLNNYYWLIGAGFFSTALYINVLTYSPVHIPTGRITLFIPCIFGAPQMGLGLLTLYGFTLVGCMLNTLLHSSTSSSNTANHNTH